MAVVVASAPGHDVESRAASLATEAPAPGVPVVRGESYNINADLVAGKVGEIEHGRDEHDAVELLLAVIAEALRPLAGRVGELVVAPHQLEVGVVHRALGHVDDRLVAVPGEFGEP